jgi:hypothetical protein
MIIKATVHFDTYTQTYNISRVKPESEVESITLDAIGLLTVTYKDGAKRCFLNMPMEITMDDVK